MATYTSGVPVGKQYGVLPSYAFACTAPWQRVGSHAGRVSKQRNPLQSCHGLIRSSVTGGLVASWRNRYRRKPWFCSKASGRTELLVDGDTHSIDDIISAIKCLKAHGEQRVCTTLFAPPERRQNKKWGDFVRDHGISFRPVHRRTIKLGSEPNDKAITKTMWNISKSRKVCIAILTQDLDFVDAIFDLDVQGTKVKVLLMEDKMSAIKGYERQGIEVLRVTLPEKGRLTKVRAILHQDGTGSVKFADPYKPVSCDKYLPAQDKVLRVLQDLGYGDANEGYALQKCAKFWFTNRLGSLEVFPYQPSVMEVHRVLTEESTAVKTWESYSGNLAFILPIFAQCGFKSRIHGQTFGNGKARAVFRAGGPFMLEDSSNLVVHALRKLGFLDDGFNADVAEAMLVFMNSSENNNTLRKMDLLPSRGDQLSDVERKLRMAFVSQAAEGKWRIKNKSPKSGQAALAILRKAKLLTPGNEYSTEELFEAMQLYAKQQQLPVLRTFNGLAWRIFVHHDRDPTRRKSIIDFVR
eukprot:Skav218510  [mRNA]  locus=scaffold1564:198425:199993:+ [translate_table: standard]